MPRRFIRNLTGKNRSRRADIQLGILLAFVAGAVNAGGFLAVGRYTSHMTGIVSSIADYLALNKFNAALGSLGLLFSFISGAVVSTLIIRWGKKRNRQSQYALALMLEAALLLAFGISVVDAILPSIYQTAALLCFIMGLQNAIITKISNAEIRTTHVTGLATDMGIELGRYLTSFRDKTYNPIVQHYKMKLHSGLLCSFLVGAVMGAISFKHFGFLTTIPLALLLIIAASVPIMDDLKVK